MFERFFSITLFLVSKADGVERSVRATIFGPKQSASFQKDLNVTVVTGNELEFRIDGATINYRI
jgi:hypothetical protein